MKERKSFNLLQFFGNCLIVVSLLGFAILFYPIAQMYLFPQRIPSSVVNSKTYSVLIPKINAYSPIVRNVDPWDEKEYMKALKNGVAQASGTADPGEAGSIYLFAHSTGNPFEMNRYNTIFYRLSELGVGDKIIINYQGKAYTYLVDDKKEVWPSDIKYLEDALKNKKDQLVLQTCTPIGTSLKRLLVFARPVTN